MIADQYLQLKGGLESALAGLIKLGSEMRRPPEEMDTLQALLRDISEPLLFVVVGEVKSGKSSLLNALFGNEFAKVDVLPATDRVYIFRYGPQEKSTEVSPKLTERHLPIPFLRDFNVVDTPGTNTMVKEHQMVADDFMPRADVVLFVFSVANPWTQSNWEFLDFLQKTWLRNVSFVLQQIDLREPTEIDVIHRHLQDTAMRRLGFVPPIFSVSARKALLARTSGDEERLWVESGFAPLEEQISFIVTESSARMLKLRSTFQATRVALEELNREVRGFLDKIAADVALLERLDALLQTRREQMLRQVTALVREVESIYEETTKERTTLLRQELTWWRGFQLIWRRTGDHPDLHAKIETKLRQLLQPQMQPAVSKLEIDLRGLWPQMQDLLENQSSSDLQKEARQSVPDFAGQRRELSESIQAAFIDILAGKTLQEQLARSYSQTALWLRVVVAIIAIAGAVAVFARARSATAAMAALMVAGIGVVLAVFLAFNPRRKVLRDYERQFSPKRTEFSKTLEKQFAKAIDAFCAEMAKKFRNLSEICQTRRRRYEPWSQRAEELQTQLTELKPRLG